MLTYMLRFAALPVLGLLATVSYAAAVPAVPAAASSSAKPLAKLIWPKNGIAQRYFPHGNVMFVENDHGKLSAWVLSTYTRSMMIDQGHTYAKALNFFTGKVMKVKVELVDDGHEDQAFTASDGTYHYLDPSFVFSGTEMGIDLPEIKFYGGNVALAGSTWECDVNLDSTTPETNYVTGEKPAVVWKKFPIYHLLTGSKGCVSGNLGSTITSALDLGDGTFLASEGCFVFRLLKSDLSPVGLAPALTVVDESTLKAAIAKVKDKKIKNATGYLIKKLHLQTAPDVSCKDEDE